MELSSSLNWSITTNAGTPQANVHFYIKSAAKENIAGFSKNEIDLIVSKTKELVN